VNKFTYKTVKGDVLEHKFNPAGSVVLPHVVNTLGCMGSGVAAGIRQKWSHANHQYESWCYDGGYYSDLHIWITHKFELGEVQFVDVGGDVVIANMVGQKDIGPNEFGMPPIRMDSLRECIFYLRKFVIENNIVSVAAPKFGSLRSGGVWSEIEAMVKEIFRDVAITWVTYEYVEPSFARKQMKGNAQV